jgi:hypothetical protein
VTYSEGRSEISCFGVSQQPQAKAEKNNSMRFFIFLFQITGLSKKTSYRAFASQ